MQRTNSNRVTAAKQGSDAPAPRHTPWYRVVWRHRWAYIFVSPFFILFAVFALYPILFSLWLSFHEWNGFTAMQFTGLDNYQQLFRDSYFWNSMLNTVILFFIYVPFMTFSAIVLATALHNNFLKFQGLWRALLFLPHLTSMVAAGFVFRLILDTQSGIANQVLGWFSLSPIPWLDDIWWARVSLGLLMIWAWLGYNTVIMLAGLQTISNELNEAARIDGANRSQIFWSITVPLLRPVILFSVTLSIIGTFQMFTEPFILTRGGPIGATETPVMQIFSTLFNNIRYGYAAAMSYVFFVTILIAAVIQSRFFRGGTS